MEQPSWSAGSQRSPVPNSVPCRAQSRVALEPPLVDLLRDEPAHVGVHAPGLGQEDPAVRRHRHVVAEHVLEHARARRPRGARPARPAGAGADRPAGRCSSPTSRRPARRPAPADRPRRRSARRRVRPAGPVPANSHVVPATRLNSLLAHGRIAGDVGRRPAGRRGGRRGTLRTAWSSERSPCSSNTCEDLLEQVVDGVVAHGGDADPPAGADRALWTRWAPQ